MYIYIKTEKQDHDNPKGLWTVGFYDPDGKWQSESDHESRDEAARRVHWLHGGE